MDFQKPFPGLLGCHVLLVSLFVLPGPLLTLCLQSMPQSPSASVFSSTGLEGWRGTRQKVMRMAMIMINFLLQRMFSLLVFDLREQAN